MNCVYNKQVLIVRVIKIDVWLWLIISYEYVSPNIDLWVDYNAQQFFICLKYIFKKNKKIKF